jgi:hypothetical protein
MLCNMGDLLVNRSINWTIRRLVVGVFYAHFLGQNDVMHFSDLPCCVALSPQVCLACKCEISECLLF